MEQHISEADHVGPYLIEGGTLRFIFRPSPDGQSKQDVCQLPADVAVVFDNEGILLKHGAAADIDRWRARVRDLTVCRDISLDDYLGIRILRFPLNEETVEFLNDCVNTTGYVALLEDRLLERHYQPQAM